MRRSQLSRKFPERVLILLYFADLASLTAINIAESTDGGTTWFKPGPGGAAGDVDASSDRQWLSWDRYPTATDLTVYEMDHEAASEEIRFNASAQRHRLVAAGQQA